MSDDAIILDTLKFIDHNTNPPPYVNVFDTIWYNFSQEKKEHLRRIMLPKAIINLNDSDHREFKLRSEAYNIIYEENKKLQCDFLKFIQKQPNIEFFMVSNFVKPDPKSVFTTHEHDNAVIFLKELKGQGLIEYDREDLNHISNNWYEEEPPINKRWFDTVDKNRPFLVELTTLGKNYLLLEDSFPIKTPIIEQTIPPKRSSHVGIKVWNVVKNIWKFISENPLISAVIAAIIFYFVVIFLSNHNIKPKP